MADSKASPDKNVVWSLSRPLWGNICAFLDSVDAVYIAMNDIEMLSPACHQIAGKLFPKKKDICFLASGIGRLHIVEWICRELSVWDPRAWEIAARNGHLHILQWMHSKIHPCDIDVRSYGTDICSNASFGGQLSVLQWGWEKRLWTEDDASFVEIGAASCGHTHILEWYKGLGKRLDAIFICGVAIRNGRLEVLQWMRENNLTLDAIRIADLAATEKQAHIQEWVRALFNQGHVDPFRGIVTKWAKRD